MPKNLNEIIVHRQNDEEIWGFLVEGDTDESNRSMPSRNQFLPSVAVVDIKPGSSADEAGLKPGHEIWEIEGTKVFELSYADFIYAVEEIDGNSLKMLIDR